MQQALRSVLVAMALLLPASSASAILIHFTTTLSGPNENPPNASPGTGFADVLLDTLAHTLSVHAEFSGLVAPSSAAHIHCCVAPPGNVGIAVPRGASFAGSLGVTAGSFDAFLDLTDELSYRVDFINNFGGGTAAGAEAALTNGLLAGRAYFNVHSTTVPAGEIRGFLAVPEPGSLALLGIGLLAFGVSRTRNKT